MWSFRKSSIWGVLGVLKEFFYFSWIAIKEAPVVLNVVGSSMSQYKVSIVFAWGSLGLWVDSMWLSCSVYSFRRSRRHSAESPSGECSSWKVIKFVSLDFETIQCDPWRSSVPANTHKVPKSSGSGKQQVANWLITTAERNKQHLLLQLLTVHACVGKKGE